MDPNKLLNELRSLVADELADREPRDDDPPRAKEIAERFEDLDRWLSRGGFTPKDWQCEK